MARQVNGFVQGLRECCVITRALYHTARLRYYTVALESVGHLDPDSPYLTMCCIESQRIVEDFLTAREAA